MKTQSLTKIALLAAILAIFGPLSLPLGPIPLSLASFFIYLALYILGRKDGLISLSIYILLGLIGLPVFSGFGAGPSKVLGPTGGFIIGYLALGFIGGYFVDKYPKSSSKQFLGLLLANLVLYIFGASWLAYQASINLRASLTLAVFPFIPGDLLKILLAIKLGPKLRDRINIYK